MRQCVFGESFFDEDMCVDVMQFTEIFTDIYPKLNLDPWVITSDNKVLHWGSLIDEDISEVENIAWETAYSQTNISIEDYGFNDPKDITEDELKNIKDEDLRGELESFKEIYNEELDRILCVEYSDGAMGWYSFGDELTAEHILENGLKIS
jgi:hypothetical protein